MIDGEGKAVTICIAAFVAAWISILIAALLPAKPPRRRPSDEISDIYIPTAAGRLHYRREPGEKLFHLVDGG